MRRRNAKTCQLSRWVHILQLNQHEDHGQALGGGGWLMLNPIWALKTSSTLPHKLTILKYPSNGLAPAAASLSLCITGCKTPPPPSRADCNYIDAFQCLSPIKYIGTYYLNLPPRSLVSSHLINSKSLIPNPSPIPLQIQTPWGMDEIFPKHRTENTPQTIGQFHFLVPSYRPTTGTDQNYVIRCNLQVADSIRCSI